MRRLFARKTEEIKLEVLDVQIAEQTPSTKSNYPKEVLQIHHEFFTAADNLVEQAKKVIDEANQKDINKIKRLESLGFKQVNQVVEAKQELLAILEAKLAEINTEV